MTPKHQPGITPRPFAAVRANSVPGLDSAELALLWLRREGYRDVPGRRWSVEVTARSQEVRVVVEFSWRGWLRRGRRSARLGPPASAGAAGFDWNKVHPSWRPGVGFELRLGDRPGTPITLDGLRTHIAAARVVHGDEEADRLQAELDGLLAIKKRCEAGAPTGTEAGHAGADVR